MTSVRIFAACMLTGLLAAGPLLAQVDMPAPNWTVAAARNAAAEGAADTALEPLFESIRTGEERRALDRLRAVADDRRLPVPARERILYEFAQGLGDLPPGSAGPGVLQFLLSYPARTLVPHPDNDLVGTPYFNIRGATAGSLNEWARQAGYDQARTRFEQAGDDASTAFLADYRAADLPRRRGLLQALPLASAPQLQALAGESLRALPTDPELMPVTAQTALLLGDGDGLQTALLAGDGPELAGLLAEAAETLDEPTRIALLSGLVNHASPTRASLAIARLAPGLLQLPEIADQLFELLDDPALGPAAALALAASGRPEVTARLAQRAAANQGLASRRAAMALGVVRQSRPGGAR